MNKKIEVLIDKYGLTHLKEELMNTVFPCIKVVPKQEETSMPLPVQLFVDDLLHHQVI